MQSDGFGLRICELHIAIRAFPASLLRASVHRSREVSVGNFVVYVNLAHSPEAEAVRSFTSEHSISTAQPKGQDSSVYVLSRLLSSVQVRDLRHCMWLTCVASYPVQDHTDHQDGRYRALRSLRCLRMRN